MTRTNPEQARLRMVEYQLRRRGIRDERVLQALATVPRHLFIPSEQALFAYDDGPLPIGYRQTISQPYIVAYMTEQLQVGPQHSVLEIGTGCGYQSAILSLLARTITSVEIVPELAREAAGRLRQLGYNNVAVHHGDGRCGCPDLAPFDRILVTAAPDQVPQPLIDQLAPDGRLVIPVGVTLFNQNLEIVVKDRRGRIKVIPSLGVRFVPLV